MKTYEDYYVVGIYRAKSGIPVKIYKVVTDMPEAVQCYFNYWEDPCCYVGYYHKNELVELYRFVGDSVEGPGIFKTQSVTIDNIKNYQDYM